MIVIAGFGGGGSFPRPVSWQEKEAWSRMTGNIPNQWELRTLTAMDTAYLGVCNGNKGEGKQHQGIGEYCNGADVEECRKLFGAQLEMICSTCPE